MARVPWRRPKAGWDGASAAVDPIRKRTARQLRRAAQSDPHLAVDVERAISGDLHGAPRMRKVRGRWVPGDYDPEGN